MQLNLEVHILIISLPMQLHMLFISPVVAIFILVVSQCCDCVPFFVLVFLCLRVKSQRGTPCLDLSQQTLYNRAKQNRLSVVFEGNSLRCVSSSCALYVVNQLYHFY